MDIIKKFFSVTIPDSIAFVFDKIGTFLDAVVIFALNLYSVILILVFILIFIAYFGLPVYVHQFWVKYKKTFFKMFRI
jgi:hypothetical protein